MTITTADAQLVAGHLAGAPAALAGIYDRFADSLHDTAAAMLSNRDDAADVMQDVFLIAASKLDQLRDPERLKPWLFAILRNEVYRRTRQRKRTTAGTLGRSAPGIVVIGRTRWCTQRIVHTVESRRPTGQLECKQRSALRALPRRRNPGPRHVDPDQHQPRSKRPRRGFISVGDGDLQRR